MAKQHFGKCVNLFGTIYRTCRIIRRAEDNQSRTRSDSRLKRLGSEDKIVVHRGANHDRHALGEFHHLGITDPAGRRQDNLVAFAYQRLNSIADSLLGSYRNDNIADSLLGSYRNDNIIGREDVFPTLQGKRRHILGSRSTQPRSAGHRSVMRHIGIHCVLHRLLDICGRRKIRLAYRHTDHVKSRLLEFTGLGTHRQRGRGGDLSYSF